MLHHTSLQKLHCPLLQVITLIVAITEDDPFLAEVHTNVHFLESLEVEHAFKKHSLLQTLTLLMLATVETPGTQYTE